MSCSNLITYNTPYLNQISFTDSDVGTIVSYIKASTAAIERYCKRIFSLTSHNEWQTVGQFGQVLLNNYPVTSLDHFYAGKVAGLRIENSSDSNASASVNTTEATIRLNRVASGSGTTNALEYSTYSTLTSLATAITAVGSGWVGTVIGAYGGFPSSDIAPWQVSTVRGNGTTRQLDLSLWVEDGSYFTFANDSGIVETRLNRGQQIRVKYQAGFAEIPDDLQKVCADLVANMFDQTSNAIQSENLGDYSYTLAQNAIDRIPLNNRKILDGYRERRP